MRWTCALVAVLAASAAISAATTARATPRPVPPPNAGSTVAEGLAIGGLVPSGVMFGWLSMEGMARSFGGSPAPPSLGYTVTLDVAAALGLGLGSAAVGLQATRPGKCDSTCDTVYGIGGTALGLGAVVGIVAIAYHAQFSRGAPRVSLAPAPALRLAPLFIPTGRGVAVGVGLTGVVF